jgi:polyribonucleotide nucleotidyltransferase
MPTPHTVTLRIAGTQLSFETGRIARLASGAVVGRCQDHVVLATVVAAPEAREGVDFLPLQVEYREKLAAAGRIPGSFGRREGRITDHEVLTSRLIDRTIRSLFPSGFRRETQLQVSVLSADPESDITSLAILTATAALHASPVPAKGPAAGLRIVRWGDAWHAFPTERQRREAELDFVVSAGPDGLVMVEGEAREVPEDVAAQALEVAQQWAGKLAQGFEELRAASGVEKQAPPVEAPLPALPDGVEDELARALRHEQKAARLAEIAAARELCLAHAAPEERELLGRAFERRRYELVREAILAEGRRLDGRGPRDIRPISGEVGWLPRPHGSAVFTRGETQALVTCTLGAAEDAQRIEGLGGMREERFLLHYNFPPYSVGEVRPLRGPGRREIGHGFLARRGLLPLLPPFEDFPYTIRVESEISESNGSSSMATVCGGTLAMLHAGVPLRASVAGIAMGLVTDGARTAVLSDILGDEDHLGDMDFKVVGTARGITALQLDNKVGGLTHEQLTQALAQAAAGRAHILGEMAKMIAEPKPELAARAPRVAKTTVMPSSLGALVGPRGANLRAIETATGARVSIDDDGAVLVYAADARSAKKAMVMVQRTAGVLKAQKLYRAVITGVKDFGAFARINDVNEGLIPSGQQGEKPLAEGSEVVVRVHGTDGRGRLRLSLVPDADEALIEY